MNENENLSAEQLQQLHEDRVERASKDLTKELSRAVSDVMEQIERLKKADDNSFAKYRFTSVDDYKDHIRPLMAKNGLSIGMSQVNFEFFTHKGDKKESEHCRFDFEIWLEHSSGQSSDKEYTTVCLPYTMAQTSGQARSYALKEWLKSKFMASSGDVAEDADALSYGMKFSKAEARKIYENLTADLVGFASGGDQGDLTEWVDKNKILLDAMPDDWSIHLRNEYKQAEIAIRIRERGEDPDPVDYDLWLQNFDQQLDAVNTEDDLNEVWVEHEDAIGDMPSPVQATAKRLYGNHLERARNV